MLFGKAYIKTDGTLLRSLDGAKLDLGGNYHTAVKGSHTVHGHTSKIKESMLECEIVLAQGDSLESIRNINDATVTFECDSGQTYVVRGAALAETLSITEGDDGGKIPVKLTGQPAEEMN